MTISLLRKTNVKTNQVIMTGKKNQKFLSESALSAPARTTGAIPVLIGTCFLSFGVLGLGLAPSLAPPPGLDRVAHAGAFTILILPAALFRPGLLWMMVPALAGLGAAIEYVQPYFGRSTSLSDMLANLFGLASGTLLGSVLRRHLKIRNHLKGGL
jgi:hypothetical protein